MTRAGHIEVVEQAYHLVGDDPTWLARTLEPLGELLGPAGAVAFVADQPDMRDAIVATSSAMRADAAAAARAFAVVAPQLLEGFVRVRALGVGVASEDLAALGIDLHANDHMRAMAHPIGIRDGLVVRARCATGRSLVVVAPSDTTPTIAAARRRRWQRTATHLLSALRLRRGLAAAEAPEAILEPSGRVVHAEGEARRRDARDALRDAAIAVDRARSSVGRADPDEALASWRALVLGRYSLVDQFERDGRRFLVARRNDPEVASKPLLSRREVQVAALLALGRSQTQIAYELGLSPGYVSSTVQRATAKLGLRSPAELVQQHASGATPFADERVR